jgi:hypothetical protein
MKPGKKPQSMFYEWNRAHGPRPIWVCYPYGLLPPGMAGHHLYDNTQEQSLLPGALKAMNNHLQVRTDAAAGGHSLVQESFFVCTVKNVGDIPGTGSIYVETVVDCDSGMAFAKFYPARNAAYAVDILVSTVIPFLRSHKIAIEQVFTRKTEEYCGLPLAHAYETFLMRAQIRHVSFAHSDLALTHCCEDFYQVLLREFVPPLLRKKFDPSFDEIQKELDAFVDEYNLAHVTRDRDADAAAPPAEPSSAARCNSVG